MTFYLQNTNMGMVLDVKKGTGPEVVMFPLHGGINQLWEYKNGMIYSKLNGWVQHRSGDCGKIPSWDTYNVSSFPRVQDGPASLWCFLPQDALTWNTCSLKILLHFLRPVITTTIELNHKKNFTNSSPSLHNNETAQILGVPTNPKDSRSYPTPSTSSFHTQTTYSPPSDPRSKLRYHSYHSSSEDIHETQLDNQNGWQQIRRTKRKRLLNSYPPTQPPLTETRNRYEMLTEDNSHP